MNRSSKTKEQLLLEIEELRTKLKTAERGPQELGKGLQAGMTEGKRTDQVLEDLVKFETLLAELSARFVNLPSDGMDSYIAVAQRRICELLGLDRFVLWEVSDEDPGTMFLTHLYYSSTGPLPDRPMGSRDFYPWSTHKLLNKETVIISRITDLPTEAARDRESCRVNGTRSVVGIPLSVGEGPVLGALTFGIMREERSWPESVVRGFRLIAEVFANVLERKRMDDQLREHIREIEELKEGLEKENIYL